LVAAQKLNENETLPVYGIVTDGQLWQFGRLIGNVFTFHKSAVTTSDLERLFGFINGILEAVVSNISL
jgi:hypothetical protein